MIRLEQVGFAYEDRAVLEDLTLRFPAGVTLLTGPNGAGKSTLLKLAAGVERPDSGRILVMGHDLWEEEIASRKALAYIPEHPDVTPYARLDEVMGLVCRLRGVALHEGRDALRAVGMEEHGHAILGRLSRGQRRRVLLAAAMIGKPRVFLMDEPLEAMDSAMCRLILEWIETLARSDAALVVATHRLGPFAGIADRVVSLTGDAIRSMEVPRDDAGRKALFAKLTSP